MGPTDDDERIVFGLFNGRVWDVSPEKAENSLRNYFRKWNLDPPANFGQVMQSIRAYHGGKVSENDERTYEEFRNKWGFGGTPDPGYSDQWAAWEQTRQIAYGQERIRQQNEKIFAANSRIGQGNQERLNELDRSHQEAFETIRKHLGLLDSTSVSKTSHNTLSKVVKNLSHVLRKREKSTAPIARGSGDFFENILKRKEED